MHESRCNNGCRDFDQLDRINRRVLLQIGGISPLGMLLPDLLRAQSEARSSPTRRFGSTKSVIFMYLHGGHAQQETWDPKPYAPENTRGIFNPISTSLPGTQICELLPFSATIMDRISVVRSMSHENANHVQASLSAMTGHSHPPETKSRGDFPPSGDDFPPFGAVIDSLRPSNQLPTWVQIGPQMRRNNGTVLHGQIPGFLGSRHAPFIVNQNLLSDTVEIEATRLAPEISIARLNNRQDILHNIDQQRAMLDRAANVYTFDSYQQRAFSLLSSKQTANAFDLAQESSEVRCEYGENQFGQASLLARRLVEAGVPIINVHYCHTPKGSWDTHSKHFSKMKDSLCPTFDRAFSTLVNDLDARGLLEQTLVFPNAEFGRTPKINGSSGRDHWPWVYSLALAGGGLKAGFVYGSSDRMAAYPDSHAHNPADMAATVYHLLGIDSDTTIYDQFQRPRHLVTGTAIDALLS